MGEIVKKENGGEIKGLPAIERAAEYVARSGLFGVKTKEQAVALMLLAQAEGIHPMRAVQEYHIIQGRPAMRADAMLARFQRAGGKVIWHELTDERARATFEHPQGGKVTIEWDLERAKRAGLLGKAGSNWEKYPRAMLRSRVISEGIRTVYPGVIVGIYTPEEVESFVEGEPVEPEPPESEPAEVKPESSTNLPNRATLTHRFTELFRDLGWSSGQGREFTKGLFGKTSAKELTDEELQKAVERMEAIRRDELTKEWGKIHKTLQVAGFSWEGLKEEIKVRFKKENPDDLTLAEVRELLAFLETQKKLAVGA